MNNHIDLAFRVSVILFAGAVLQCFTDRIHAHPYNTTTVAISEVSRRYPAGITYSSLFHLHSVLQRNSSTFLTRNSGAHPPGVSTRGNSIRRWNSLSNDELLGEDSGRFQHLAANATGGSVYNSDKNLVIIPNHYQNNTPTARLLNSSFSSCELVVFVWKK